MEKIKKMFSVIEAYIGSVFGAIGAFSVLRFDNLGPGMLSLFNKELSKQEKKNIAIYTLKNFAIFIPASKAINSVLELTMLQSITITVFFFMLGLIVYGLILIIEKKDGSFKELFLDMVKVINITLRIGFFVRLVMLGVIVFSQVPYIGPTVLLGVIVFNLPRCLKECWSFVCILTKAIFSF